MNVFRTFLETEKITFVPATTACAKMSIQNTYLETCECSVFAQTWHLQAFGSNSHWCCWFYPVLHEQKVPHSVAACTHYRCTQKNGSIIAPKPFLWALWMTQPNASSSLPVGTNGIARQLRTIELKRWLLIIILWKPVWHIYWYSAIQEQWRHSFKKYNTW